MRTERFQVILNAIDRVCEPLEERSDAKSFLDLLEKSELDDQCKLALAYLAFGGSYYDGYDAISELLIGPQFNDSLRAHLKNLPSTNSVLVDVREFQKQPAVLMNLLDANINANSEIQLQVRPTNWTHPNSAKHSVYRLFRQNIWVPLANRFELVFWTLKKFDRLKLQLLARRHLKSFAEARRVRERSESRIPLIFSCPVVLVIDRNYRKDLALTILRMVKRYRWQLKLEIPDTFMTTDRALDLVPLLKVCESVSVKSEVVKIVITKWRDFLGLDFKIEVVE